MPRVTFAKPFDYRVPGKPSIIAYEAGWSGNVPKVHADAADQANVLVEEKSDDVDRPTL